MIATSGSLPLPSTADAHAHSHSTSSISKLSKRSLRVLILCALVLVTLCAYVLSTNSSFALSSSTHRVIDTEALDRLLEHDASSEVVNGEKWTGEGLTRLGLEADQSFHLGSTELGKYRAELEAFVVEAFPKSYHKDALASIARHLGEGNGQTTSFSPIPHKIWQTAKVHDPNVHPQWKEQTGFQYKFMNDAMAEAWMKKKFDGSLIYWTWDRLPNGILKSDFLRYIFVLFEGGIYTDTDTAILKTFEHWGSRPVEHDASTGPPSLIVGIEADVGTRGDWHKWWPRPLQICQWTIAGAPMHPVLIDTVRRVYLKNLEMDKWRKEQGLSETQADATLKEAVKNNEAVGSVMEWTGPGVFTDATMTYLKAVHKTEWPALKDIREPHRFRETVILPVTGFSPGVGMFNAGEIYDSQAMVHHYFSGSWKHNQ